MHITKLLIFFTFRVRTRKNVVQNVLQHFTSNKVKKELKTGPGFEQMRIFNIEFNSPEQVAAM